MVLSTSMGNRFGSLEADKKFDATSDARQEGSSAPKFEIFQATEMAGGKLVAKHCSTRASRRNFITEEFRRFRAVSGPSQGGHSRARLFDPAGRDSSRYEIDQSLGVINADTDFQHSWNSAHVSRGCRQPDLIATAGAGLFCC